MKLAPPLLAMLILVACGDGDGRREPKSIAGTCGLPTPSKRASEDLVPDEFVFEGMEVAKTEQLKGRILAAINAPYSVQAAFDRYLDAVEEAGFEIVGKDNEGFEAELYIRKGKELGAIQIRMSTCPDATAVYINLLEDATAGTVPSPSPRTSR